MRKPRVLHHEAKRALLNLIEDSVLLACHEPRRPGAIDPVYVAISPHRIACEVMGMLVSRGYIAFDTPAATPQDQQDA